MISLRRRRTPALPGEPLSLPTHVLQRLLRRPARFLFRTMVGWHVEGLQHVPDQGGAIVIANHTSWLDPPLLAMLFDRPIYFMTKQELFRSRVLKPLLWRAGAFPVHRHAPDRRAIRLSIALLRRGYLLSVMPEGHRSRTGGLGTFHEGAALLAQHSQAWILPLAIRPGYGFRRPVRVVIGEPFRADTRATREEVTRRMYREVERLLQQAQGVDPSR